MKVVTETEAVSGGLRGLVELVRDKLYCKSDAIWYAQRAADKDGGIPVLCEYDDVSPSGRQVKRYLPLIQTTDQNEIERKVNEQ